MNDTLKLIETRRSIKKYKSDMPSESDINAIIKAGLEAASGRNLQSPLLVAITNKKIRDELSLANASVMGASSDPFYGAPVVIVVLAKRDVSTHVYDGSLSLGNMMLAAHSLGLGSCWVHRAKEVFDMPKWKEYLREIGIEDDVEGIGNLIVGYPDCEYPAEKPRTPGRAYFID